MSHLWLTNNLVSSDYNVDFTLVTGTAQTQFPLTNILNKSTTKVSRVTVDGGVVEFYVDLKQELTSNVFAILGSSVDGLGFTACSIFGSTTTDFSGSSEIVVDVSDDYNFGFKEYTDVTYRYWKIKLTAGSYAEVSNFYIGPKTELTNNYINANTFSFTNQTLLSQATNKYGQQFKKFYNRIQILNGSIILLKDSDKTTIEDIYTELGTYEPFYFICDPDGSLETDSEYKYSGYYYFLNDPPLSSQVGNFWNTQFQLLQVG